MTMTDAVKRVMLEKYAVFSGRATRSEYWYFVLALFLLSFIMGFFTGLFGFGLNEINTFSLALQIATLIPSIAVSVRRVHDTDHSGWFVLVPFYNLYLMIIKGTEGPNRFGADELGA